MISSSIGAFVELDETSFTFYGDVFKIGDVVGLDKQNEVLVDD